VNSKGSKLSGDRFPGGVKGWVGQYQDMGVTLFLTPDGKHVISGYLYDDKGQNLSEGILKKRSIPH
jgi:thiol:disulfide interchange protein DsbG